MAEAVNVMDSDETDELSLENDRCTNRTQQSENKSGSDQVPLKAKAEPTPKDEYYSHDSHSSIPGRIITPYTKEQQLSPGGPKQVHAKLTHKGDCSTRLSVAGQTKPASRSQVSIKPESTSKADNSSQYSRPKARVRTKKKSVHHNSSDVAITRLSKSDVKLSSKSVQSEPNDPVLSEKPKAVSNNCSDLITPPAQTKSSRKKRSRSRRNSQLAAHDSQLPEAVTNSKQQSSSISTARGRNHDTTTGSKANKPTQLLKHLKPLQPKLKPLQPQLKPQTKPTPEHKPSADMSLVTEVTVPHSSNGKRRNRAKKKTTCLESDSGQNHQAKSHGNVKVCEPKQAMASITTEHLQLCATSNDQQQTEVYNSPSPAYSVEIGQKEVSDKCFATQDTQMVVQVHAQECTVMSKSEEFYIQPFRKEIKAMRMECIQCCEERIAKLTTKLSSDTKIHNIQSLEDISEAIEQHSTEKNMVRITIDEVRNRQRVFLHYCEQIETRLNELSKAECNNPFIFESLYSTFKREVSRYDKALPIYAHRLTILAMLHCNQVSVLIGETGSGKSTQLVQYLYEAGYSWYGLIACTQPRKLAARSLANHVSNEAKENLGETYDYIDSEGKWSRGARMVFMTDYMLLNECIADPYLRKYSCLVIDEAHERSIHTDILMALIKRCLPHRPDLRVIITSATINPTLFSRYFGGDNECPIIEVPGRVYPVQVTWSAPQPSILEQDYVSETVKKVYDIHISKRKEQGDVLVFLTCPAEIERAGKLAQQLLKNEAVILPLHGQLQPEEQQKVFQPTHGKRKVIFATNVAETSITIPGIVYVVDTGLSKELCYDPQKNMNSLEIRPISKSSADQRKGRAGRTCPGECYRLYSEEDYMQMKDNSVPEILRITLAFAVMKLYEFGIKEIHSFEFIESPDRKALDDAIENLKFLGAIKRGKLTELGRKMAMLPLEPNLSKVLFDAINKGIGLEAAAAVSISTLAGRVFFRPDTTESQAESDKKKLPFCQPTGDQMTYLHTYFEWSRQQGWKDQTRWCMENYVNAKSMRMVQQTIDELRYVLYKVWHIDLPPKIRSLEEADALLPKIFFDAFATNICIHLGHSAVGYWSDKLPGEQLVIYPASSLKQLNSVPQCVVYEKTHKTSQHFLLQALPVREEWIHEAVESGKLMCHPADHPYFEVYKVEPLLFINGPWIARELYQKYPHDRRIAVPEFSEYDVQPVFEHSKQSGSLKIFAQKQNHAHIQTCVKAHIESLKKQLRNDSHTCNIKKNSNVKIVIGLGGCVQGMLMLGDTQKIVIRGIDNEEQVPKVKTELSSYGECTCNSSSNERGIQLFVRYQNPSDASRALSHRFHGHNFSILKCPEKSRRNYSLKVEWWRRRRQDFAFIVFSKDEEFHSLVSPVFHDSYHEYFYYDPPSKLTFVRTISRSSLKVSGTKILLGVSEDYVVSRLLSFLPECAETDFSVYFIYDAQFEETDGSLSSQQYRLETKLAECDLQSHRYTVIMERPQPKRVMYKAWIYFEESSECTKMYRQLSEEIALRGIEDDEDSTSESDDSDSESESDEDTDCNSESESRNSDCIDDDYDYDEDNEDDNINDDSEDDNINDDSEDDNINDDDEDDNDDEDEEDDNDDEDDDEDDSSEDGLDWEMLDEAFTLPSKAEIVLTYSARYTQKFFSAIEPKVSYIRQKFLLASSCVMIDYDKKDKWNNVFLKLSANEYDVFQNAKKELEKAAEPSVVPCKTALQNQYVSTAAFRATLKELQEKTSTFVKINRSGLSMPSIAIYGTKTNRKTAKREIQTHLESISHDGIDCYEIDLKSYSPGLMKLLVDKYGYDTTRLSETHEGIVATRLVPRWHILTLFATEAGHQSILRLLSTLNPHNDTIAQALPCDHEQTDETSLECCVCFSNLHLSQIQRELHYQLESCGHAYCRECIELQLQSNTIKFPVTCAADECGEELVWRDFENLFKLGIKKHQDIKSASLSAYVTSNPHMVRNCITPDCEMVYFVSRKATMHTCDECEVKICSCCHSKWHENYTCEEFESRHNPTQSLKIWMKKDEANHKICPKCDTVIQKVGGCQHVKCHCGSHICWDCMQYFTSQKECYSHLKSEHRRYVQYVQI